MQSLKFRLHEQSIRRSVTEIFIYYFYSILGGGPWRGSVRVVRGPVRRQSADPVRSGSPRTGGQCFRVTRLESVS